MLQAKNKRFRIITPYDAQRSMIEEYLKHNELDWEDKCFNVDSFQGSFLATYIRDHHIYVHGR
jgi:superfamily I DNA and/or RNA helicase